jgi:hypothetical protein
MQRGGDRPLMNFLLIAGAWGLDCQITSTVPSHRTIAQSPRYVIPDWIDNAREPPQTEGEAYVFGKILNSTYMVLNHTLKMIPYSKRNKTNQHKFYTKNFPCSRVMRTITPMGGIPDPPNIIVTCTAHPTPFPSAPNWPGWTFDMITTIHLLNPTTAVTWFCVRFEPDPRGCIRRKIIFTNASPVFHAGHLWMDRSTTLETSLEFADNTGEMRRCIWNRYQLWLLKWGDYRRFRRFDQHSRDDWCTI